MQMNVDLRSYEAMDTFINAPDMMFPVLWLEEVKKYTYISIPQHIFSVDYVLEITRILLRLI